MGCGCLSLLPEDPSHASSTRRRRRCCQFFTSSTDDFSIGRSQADSNCVNVAVKQDGDSGSSRSHIMTCGSGMDERGGRWCFEEGREYRLIGISKMSSSIKKHS